MANDFVNWEDLDLDEVLGTDWTDGEEYDPETEWESTDSEVPVPVVSVEADANQNNGDATMTSKNVEKENVKPRSKPTKKHYKCPVCDKQYASPSGFRGHVTKKHERPDLKAHMHQLHVEDQGVHLPPTRSLPLSTSEDIERAIPQVTKAAINEIQQDKDKLLRRPSSKSGKYILQIAASLSNIDLTFMYTFLLTHMCTFLASNTNNVDTKSFLSKIYKLRVKPDFVAAFCRMMEQAKPELPGEYMNLFLQHFLTSFTATFFKKQTELLDRTIEKDVEKVTNNDQQVVFYISGYLIHQLKKRYSKSRKNGKYLLELLNNLQERNADTKDVSDNISAWMKNLNRGGLKQPNYKFYLIIMQVERWLRDCITMNHLQSDSLIQLHAKIMDYQLLKISWDKLIPGCDNGKWIVLDHVLALFLKVRGFAVTRLLRKNLDRKRKNEKAAAGTRKALRKELKEMNNAT